MIKASAYGFVPENCGTQNRETLQEMLDTQREVLIDIPGDYDICGTIYFPDDSCLAAADGVTLCRQHDPSGTDSHFFMNAGALTGEWNRNIRLKNIHIQVNGVECTPFTYNGVRMNSGEALLGGRGQVLFMYVRDLVIEDFTLLDLAEKDYAVEISDFANVRVERIHIEGQKDAVHFGPGRDFVLRDGVFRTFDDPIALNASDYSPSAPNIGSIENGLIENCIDLAQDRTCGYFVRFIVGAWKDWEQGMPVHHSEAVIHDGKLYRAVLPADGKDRVSVTPPTHESGFAVLDGIAWCRTHLGYCAEDLPRCANIRNITLRDLTLCKKRTVGVIMYVSENEHLIGYRKGAEVPVIENVTFDGIKVDCDIDEFLTVCAPCRGLQLKNADLRGSCVRFEPVSCGLGSYPASFAMENVTNMRFEDAGAFRTNGSGEKMRVKY